MKLIILKFHIFYTYFTVKKILEVNKKQNKNLRAKTQKSSSGIYGRGLKVYW
jgi:hypothetical protein